jgi:hypothetical protein
MEKIDSFKLDAFVEGKLKPVRAFNEVYVEAPRLIGYSFRSDQVGLDRSVLVRAFIKLPTPSVECQPYIIVITHYKSFDMIDLVSDQADPAEIADIHQKRLMKEKFNYSIGTLSFIDKKLSFSSVDVLAEYAGRACGFPMKTETLVDELADESAIEKILAQSAFK